MKHRTLINDPENETMVYVFAEEGLDDALGRMKANFTLLETEDWNRELSPWPLKAGKMEFSGQAEETLRELLKIRKETEERYTVKRTFIAGYSLAGLFALYAGRYFDGIAGCSSSLWFTGFVDWFEQQGLEREKRVYLSLGKREELSRNQLLRTVGEQTRELYRWLQANGNDCILVMNEGGHFDQPQKRLLSGIAWLLEGDEHGSK